MKHTVKSSAEVQELFASGKRIKTRGFIIIYSSNMGRDLDGRAAFIAGKKLGSAPKRSYAKRVMRHIALELGNKWPGYDLIFVAKPAIFDLRFAEMLDECERALLKAGILEKETV